MTPTRSLALAAAVAWMLGPSARAADETERPSIELVVQAGRPLRIALDQQVRIQKVDQPVVGSLVEPVYAYDRVVLAAGTKVRGHVARLERVTTGARVGGILRGDFSPPRGVVLEFHSLVAEDGKELPVRTEVRSATEDVVIQSRERPRKGLVAGAAERVAEKARETVALVKRPGRMQRLKRALVSALPFHPQYLRAGTVYSAVLLEPVAFGTAEGSEPAPPGTAPPPDSVLRTRLLTALDSSTAQRGNPVQAVVTEPVFSEDHRLILPEGTMLTGEVTFAKAAARFHRHGQLRFLFESVQPPESQAETLRASLYSVQAGAGQSLAVDEEGGTAIADSKKRFAAPALAGLAFGLSFHRSLDYNTDGGPPETAYGGVGSNGTSGFMGLGLVGAALSQAWRPAAIGLGALGVARTVWAAVLGKGRNVSFPVDTVMEVQLAPAPAASPEPTGP